MTTFSERVLKIALSIPAGKVSTYGAIARAAGGGGQSARSISAILGKAYEKGERGIPFHRIVYTGGKVWMNPEYNAKRNALYKKEGIQIDKNGKILNFDQVFMELR